MPEKRPILGPPRDQGGIPRQSTEIPSRTVWAYIKSGTKVPRVFARAREHQKLPDFPYCFGPVQTSFLPFFVSPGFDQVLGYPKHVESSSNCCKTVAKTGPKTVGGRSQNRDNVHPIRPGPPARPEGCRQPEGLARTRCS